MVVNLPQCRREQDTLCSNHLEKKPESGIMAYAGKSRWKSRHLPGLSPAGNDRAAAAGTALAGAPGICRIW